MRKDNFTIAKKVFSSRLIVGTGKYRNMKGCCFDCLTPLKPDYTQFENYCLDC